MDELFPFQKSLISLMSEDNPNAASLAALSHSGYSEDRQASEFQFPQQVDSAEAGGTAMDDSFDRSFGNLQDSCKRKSTSCFF